MNNWRTILGWAVNTVFEPGAQVRCKSAARGKFPVGTPLWYGLKVGDIGVLVTAKEPTPPAYSPGWWVKMETGHYTGKEIAVNQSNLELI
jgi:hypothetical protein